MVTAVKKQARKTADTSDHGQRAVAAVAGHICLDIIPSFPPEGGDLLDKMLPGKLIDVGPALISTGGAVSNTGLALHRLGIPVALICKVGRDPFGRMILDLLGAYGCDLTDGVIVDETTSTSYTIVISPPAIDRLFFHCTGANDTFSSADIEYGNLKGIRLFHFGYPPLMRNMYEKDGKGLEDLFHNVHNRGITTTLDMAKPDPTSEAGRVDWNRVLERTLRHVDIFLPSLDEILYMIDRDAFDRLTAKYTEVSLGASVDTTLLDKLAHRLINMGAKVIAIKLGEQGLYLRTSLDVECLAMAAGHETELRQWANRQLIAPCFLADVAGTTGAGDCTVAGFLAGLVDGTGPVETINMAVGVGACSTEKPDATSGVPPWKVVRNRIAAGWPRRGVHIDMRGWTWDKQEAVWKGPQDQN